VAYAYCNPEVATEMYDLKGLLSLDGWASSRAMVLGGKEGFRSRCGRRCGCQLGCSGDHQIFDLMTFIVTEAELDKVALENKDVLGFT
jgi:hypothetical protein